MRYIIGDPSLTSYSGHCYEYMRCLAESVRARGGEAILVGNRGMDGKLAAASGALGLFTYWCDARPAALGLDPASPRGRQSVRSHHEEAIQKDLAELHQRIGFREQDIFVINTLRHWGIRGVVRWIETLPEAERPQIVLILHFTAMPNPEEIDDTPRMYREGFAAIAQSSAAGRFSLMADAEELIEEYQLYTDLPVTLAPIPHAVHDKISSPSNEGAQINLAYVGEARENKGFHLLPVLAENLVRNGLQDKIRFRIQSFIFDNKQEFYRRALAGLFHNNIELFPDQLNDAEYERYINQSDIILIPYKTDNYHSQTSGIFAEAVGRGKPVVVSRGTWMARKVKQLHCGCLFAPNDPHDLSDAVLRLLASYDDYRERARKAAESWQQFHNPESLLALIERSAKVA